MSHTGAEVRDLITGDRWTVKAHVVVNATGPFVDPIRKMADHSCKPMVTGAITNLISGSCIARLKLMAD